ncbi:uncharacterized protein LOC128241466 [Mya arenaria]|uniref:uncharacterized protein LOC128241466 n=1 Tax=Mya arenaria TaxID=6604 RepID=UPI0022E4C4CE|nr:uncharacterized protein LOC128241466 [Mya arenaria]
MFVLRHQFILLITTFRTITAQDEPPCLSRYDYDIKLMRQIVKIEETQAHLLTLIEEQTETIERNREAIANLEHKGGTLHTTYTRWGRMSCSPTAKLVYNGYAAGKKYSDSGSGSDTQCLPRNPQWSNYTDGLDVARARIYGAETEITEPNNVFPYAVDKRDLPCVVCEVPRSTVMMIPARNECFEGWTREYHGYLMADKSIHSSPHTHVCMDFEPEFIPYGAANSDEHLFYLVEAVCGSLPCPPYVNGRELACTVCSK